MFNAAVRQAQDIHCSYCRDTGHGVTGCPKFRELRWQARRGIARQRFWCYCCLGDHLVSHCQSTRACGQCGGRHHLLLCGNRNGSHSPNTRGLVTSPVRSKNAGEQWSGAMQRTSGRRDVRSPPRLRANSGRQCVQGSPTSTGGGARDSCSAPQAAAEEPCTGGARSPLHFMDWPRLERRRPHQSDHQVVSDQDRISSPRLINNHSPER
ncbi:hypothetical protein RR48_00087 [Papilio machaon]|uniref:CCHC-type domain-containing protein n=1 Tax=Papilio machaon TaxID=76193 RepID=A0A0N1PJ70_PAPMA|nr:hypothetical protein RR48_00087 [Papilio machaon]